MRSRNILLRLLSIVISYIIGALTSLLKFFVRNAYIIVAKDGVPFVSAGGRAFELIVNNVVDVMALNYFGDLALVVGRLIIVVLSGVIGYAMMVSRILIV
jgi:solute carrier family 44 (choline transporter-like protein), member 2/4/5